MKLAELIDELEAFADAGYDNNEVVIVKMEDAQHRLGVFHEASKTVHGIDIPIRALIAKAEDPEEEA